MTLAYKIDHTTTFEYPIPVSVCNNIVCLTPRPDPRLTIHRADLTITPQPAVVNERVDPFGNITHAFSIDEPHASLVVRSTAELSVRVKPIDITSKIPWETIVQAIADQSDPNWFQASPYLYDSQLVSRNRDAGEFIAPIFTHGRPIVEAVIALTEQVYKDFDYKPGSTHVDTTSTDAFKNRFGVCQDFAHAQVAALRSIGLPAQYVSGYLRTLPPPGKPRLIGADQSHAWLSLYAGPELGWIDLDPTNNVLTGTDHIPIARGRDYADIAPIRGAFLGGGESKLSVSVDVAPVV